MNSLLVFLISSLIITVISESLRKISRAVNNDYWRHICVTWENTAGSWNFYFDGVRVAKGKNFQKSHVIKRNGIVILGQDQGNYRGGFNWKKSFEGEMYRVNTWNKVLSKELKQKEDIVLHQSCYNSCKWNCN